MMSKISFNGVEAVLFDFEGTLVGNQWNRKEAVQEIIERLKGLGFPVERLQGKRYSLLKSEAIAIAPEIGQSPDQVGKEIDTIYDRYDEDALSRWSLRPRAEDFLFFLKSSGIQIGLVSNAGVKALEEAIKKLGLSSFFNIVVSRNDVQHLKPDSEGVRLALNRLEVPEEKALFVGDSMDDIQAAKEAGLRVIILLGGEDPGPDLLSGGPDFLFQDYAELIACFREERT